MSSASPTLNKSIIILCIRKFFPDVRAIYLFGSYSKFQATEESDVDIAFFCEEPNLQKEVTDLTFQLSKELKKDVDCIDLKNTNTVFATHIVDSGLLLYSLNKSEVDFFEMTIFSKYANLNEERKHIIADVLKRGSFYE